IVTSERFITQQPGVIRRFLSATAQGYTYAAQHPREAADLLRAGAQQASDLLEDARFVHDSQDWQSQRYIADASCWGVQTLEKWTNYPRFMFNHHAIFDGTGNPLAKEPDYAAAFTNDFLPHC